MWKGSQLLHARQNPLRNSADGPKPRSNLRRSHTLILNHATTFILLLTLVLLANAAEAVDYQEEWEEEADVSCAKLRLSSVKVIFFYQI